LKEIKINLEKIKKIINKDIEIRYVDKKEEARLSSLSGIVSIGGDSIKETESFYE